MFIVVNSERKREFTCYLTTLCTKNYEGRWILSSNKLVVSKLVNEDVMIGNSSSSSKKSFSSNDSCVVAVVVGNGG